MLHAFGHRTLKKTWMQITIEWIQRRATKLVPELRSLPYNERLKHLKLPTLLYRRKRGDMIQAYKILHGLDHINGNTRCPTCANKNMFQISATDKTRGHRLKLYKQEATGVRAHFFASRVVNDWNNLSEETVQATSINKFKSGLRKDWSNHPNLYNYQYQLSGRPGIQA